MRLELWEERLANLVAWAQEQSYHPGQFDCCMFAASTVEVLTGEDPAAPFRGTYSTDEGAAAVLKPYGGIRGLAEAIAWERGFQAVAPPLAQRGDVVFAVIDGRETLGICVGLRAAFPSLAGGLALLRMSSPTIQMAWHIE